MLWGGAGRRGYLLEEEELLGVQAEVMMLGEVVPGGGISGGASHDVPPYWMPACDTGPIISQAVPTHFKTQNLETLLCYVKFWCYLTTCPDPTPIKIHLGKSLQFQSSRQW